MLHNYTMKKIYKDFEYLKELKTIIFESDNLRSKKATDRNLLKVGAG